MQVEHRNCKEPPLAARTPLYLEITEAVNNLAAAAGPSQVLYTTKCTCFTSTKVQILTPEALRADMLGQALARR